MIGSGAAPVAGPELRALRRQAGLSAAAVAGHYGVARQRLDEIERRAVVSPTAARRYLDALTAAVKELPE